MSAHLGDGSFHTQSHGGDRRRWPRVSLLSHLYASLADVGVNVLVREASVNGFSVESQMRFAVGAEHRFEFQNRVGDSSTVVAVCRYAHPVTGPQGGVRYVAGFETPPQPDENLRIVLDAIAAAGQDPPHALGN